MMSDRLRQWVNDQVCEGLDWNAIKDLIRIDEAVLDEVCLFYCLVELIITRCTS